MLKRWLLLTLCGLLMFSMAACDSQEDTATQTQPSIEEDYEIAYVSDPTINRFLLTLNERTGIAVPQVSPGDAPNQYLLVLNDCQVTLTPSATGMGVMIMAPHGANSLDMLLGAFTHVVNTADKSCTKEQIENALAFVREQTSASPSYRVCNEVKIVTYLPAVKVGGTETNARLDLVLFNYIQSATKE